MVLLDSITELVENTGFVALYFSTQRESGMLHQTQHPAPLSVFSFIQRAIVGHVPQILYDIAVEDQIGVTHGIVGNQVV